MTNNTEKMQEALDGLYASGSPDPGLILVEDKDYYLVKGRPGGKTIEGPHPLQIPVYGWKVWLMKDTCRSVEKGKEPNWFHRKMQTLCFGFKWEKLNNGK